MHKIILLSLIFSMVFVCRAQVPREELENGGFGWRSAILQSGIFLTLQHGYRIADQDFTRRELKGPFIKDYFSSVKGISGWDDGDEPIANYVAHPMQGAVASYIQIQNDPRGRGQVFGANPAYWRSRLRALAWNTAYSTQYELGPLGEAAIGNVGKNNGTKGMVDLVVTPTLGMAWNVTEDALDQHAIRWLENKTENKFAKMMLRSWLNPCRSFANMLRLRPPWYRDTREGILGK